MNHNPLKSLNSFSVRHSHKLSKNRGGRQNIWSPEAKKSFAKKTASRWSDPEWADAERKRRKENGPNLSRLYHERQVSYWTEASCRLSDANDEKGASWCKEQAERHFQVLENKFSIPREELRPDLFKGVKVVRPEGENAR